jgi:hypothetical protein
MSCDVDLLGADLDAVIDRMTPPDSVRPGQYPQPLSRRHVPRIEDEPRRLEDRRRPEILFIRPIARTGRGAAAAHDTGDRFEYPALLLLALQPFPFGRWLFVDEAGEHLCVISEKGVHVDDQVLDHREGRKRLERNRFRHVLDQRLAGKPVLAVYLHRAGTADPVGAGPPEGEAAVDRVLDLRQTVKESFERLHLHGIFLPPGDAVPFRVETFYLERVFFHTLIQQERKRLGPNKSLRL